MNKKGYTLVELIITLAVIGIMIVPIFNTFLQSNRINIISKREISGAYVAQNVMERLKSSTGTELLDISNADPSHALRLFTMNSANTTFNVRVEVTDVTATLGVNLDTTVVTQPSIPTADVSITLPSQGSNGLIDFTDAFANDITINALDTSMEIRYSIDGSQVAFEHDVFNESFDVLNSGTIQMNVIGPTSGTLLDWTIELINVSNDVLRVNKVNDLENHIDISVNTSQASSSNIWISNSLPSVNGDVRNAKSWYQVVVEVEHDGIIYEVLESTIGK